MGGRSVGRSVFESFFFAGKIRGPGVGSPFDGNLIYIYITVTKLQKPSTENMTVIYTYTLAAVRADADPSHTARLVSSV